jgi:aminopeptidase N
MRLDPHSYNDTDQPEVDALEWRARVDFDTRVLDAEAILRLRTPGEGALDLDTRELEILDVTDEAGRAVPHLVEAAEPILGARLRLTLPPSTHAVRVRYRTRPSASALQWLTPAQTHGGREPFLFSQCQAIHARSVVPIQDTPRLRVRYRAELNVPAQLRGLMAAAFIERRVEGERAVEVYEMPQPIPPYLLALAVGQLQSRELGPRSRVWAEPGLVDAAAHEFAGVDAMLRTAESLFGPYDWERFDILTMPPSFPYGGMENPRLTFLTPTLLAGDRSLVNVVAHELAHSWTGNLVSNASAEHFWLNEGFTVFAERRILEALEGAELCALHAALGRRALERGIARFAERPELTRLRTRLAGIDPDEAFSEIPYEKGYLFLRALEEAVGNERFSGFLRRYVESFRFRAITTDDFVALAERELPGALGRVNAAAWLDGAGIPDGAPAPRSARLEELAALAGAPSDEQARRFSPTEWQLYLDGRARPAPHALLDELERRFHLTASRNYEVLVAWLVLAAESGYPAVLPRVEEVLGQVGRMKYLRPLYHALHTNSSTRAFAARVFARFADGYHPIARQVVEGVLAG